MTLHRIDGGVHPYMNNESMMNLFQFNLKALKMNKSDRLPYFDAEIALRHLDCHAEADLMHNRAIDIGERYWSGKAYKEH